MNSRLGAIIGFLWIFLQPRRANAGQKDRLGDPLPVEVKNRLRSYAEESSNSLEASPTFRANRLCSVIGSHAWFQDWVKAAMGRGLSCAAKRVEASKNPAAAGWVVLADL
jgi:hypothetical protein